MSQEHVQDHIDLIAKHEQDFLAKRTVAEQYSDSIATFVGSLPFVVLHLTVFAGWILLNTVSTFQHFDPAPFSLLGTCVTMEGIVLASLILMRQARVSKRNDERDHLMLQIMMLTEKEITAVIKMDRQIAGSMGLQKVVDNQEIKALSQQTSIADVAQAIQEGLPAEE